MKTGFGVVEAIDRSIGRYFYQSSFSIGDNILPISRGVGGFGKRNRGVGCYLESGEIKSGDIGNSVDIAGRIGQ